MTTKLIGKQILEDAARLHPDRHHPRIFLDQADFDRIKANMEDPLVRAAVENVRKTVEEKIMDAAPSKYEIPDGVRLLATSRRVLSRVQQCGLLYRLTGEEKYAERAYLELSVAAEFPDFHELHFLDCAELDAAFAIGYDWLYDWMSEEQKEKLREAMFTKGIMPFYREFHFVPRSGYPWYKDIPGDNWKMVCNGGLTMAVLAIFDEKPSDLYSELLTLAFADCQRAVVTFYSDLDGSYSEGPMYFGYATQYLSYYVNTLLRSCGSDYGMTDWLGLKKSPYSLLSLASNDHRSFNFGDAWCDSVLGSIFFWFSDLFGDYALSTVAKEHFEQNPGGLGFGFLSYYHPGQDGAVDALPTAYGAVGCDNAAFRSGWGEGDVFVGFHTGKNNAYHGHLDMGNFILNVGSTRFFTDLNPDNYNLKPYSGTYRYRAEGHNVPVINPKKEDDQIRISAAKLDKMKTDGETYYAVSDISAAYGEGKSVVRGVYLDKAARAVCVEDRIKADGADRIVWAAHTEATPVVAADGRSAVLALADKRLWVGLVGDGTLTVRPAAPDENSPEVAPGRSETDGVLRPQRDNTGICKLVIDLTGKEEYDLKVVMLPLPDGKDEPAQIPEFPAFLDLN